MANDYQVAIIGGGVSGATIALQLGNAGINTLLIEKNNSLVNGPPMCHLHAGGNLYPELDLDQCKALLRQSIEMVRMFPTSIDRRPTLLTFPHSFDKDPLDYKERLEQLKEYYLELISDDPDNMVLGDPNQYYKTYSKEDILSLATKDIGFEATTLDEWLIEPAKLLNWKKIKFPVFMVQEYGWNLFRLAAHAQLAIEEDPYIKMNLDTTVENVSRLNNNMWQLETTAGKFEVPYLINAAGFRSGYIDDMLHIRENRMVEFKAAYIAKWRHNQKNIPEIIFHGSRGTTDGMAQLTPYPEGYFQIHGMTEEITLFEDGLEKSTESSAQPHLPDKFIERIEKGWDKDIVCERTQKAIKHVAQYMESFSKATVGARPLYGAQQIPGNDVSRRVANVAFPIKFYARCETIKASTALQAARTIHRNMMELDLVDMDSKLLTTYHFHSLERIKISDIQTQALKLANERSYPLEMTKMIVPFHSHVKK